MRKILTLAAVVIGLHCAAIMALCLVQGCKTTKKQAEPAVPVMPPLTAPSVAPASAERAAMPSKTEETIEYTVKNGDYLGSIAKRHNVSAHELAAVNKLTDPNKIRIGQKLIIPKRGHVSATPSVKTAAKPKEKKSFAAETGEYVIVAGDNLSKIAARFNVKLKELREVNQLVNDKLKIGQKLIIPGAKKAEAAPETAPAPAAPETPAETTAAAAPSLAPTATPAEAPAETPAETPPAAAPDSSVTPPPAAATGITHVVMPNEDLNSIAKLYAITVEEIAAANKFKPDQTVQPGQKIIIP
ncbi:MAG: LysM peptidoglycan-binding domain-containing protein [Kiritimatiellae bacterium]|nr:LysM peptidoglycan-binding domain-containing protein [Kiritimatiellia bacterium]